MYIQHTTHDYAGKPMRLRVDADTRRVYIRYGETADVYLAFSHDEARELVDGITAALGGQAEDDPPAILGLDGMTVPSMDEVEAALVHRTRRLPEETPC